jgi:hypothetical protein
MNNLRRRRLDDAWEAKDGDEFVPKAGDIAREADPISKAMSKPAPKKPLTRLEEIDRDARRQVKQDTLAVQRLAEDERLDLEAEEAKRRRQAAERAEQQAVKRAEQQAVKRFKALMAEAGPDVYADLDVVRAELAAAEMPVVRKVKDIEPDESYPRFTEGWHRGRKLNKKTPVSVYGYAPWHYDSIRDPPESFAPGKGRKWRASQGGIRSRKMFEPVEYLDPRYNPLLGTVVMSRYDKDLKRTVKSWYDRDLGRIVDEDDDGKAAVQQTSGDVMKQLILSDKKSQRYELPTAAQEAGKAFARLADKPGRNMHASYSADPDKLDAYVQERDRRWVTRRKRDADLPFADPTAHDDDRRIDSIDADGGSSDEEKDDSDEKMKDELDEKIEELLLNDWYATHAEYAETAEDLMTALIATTVDAVASQPKEMANALWSRKRTVQACMQAVMRSAYPDDRSDHISAFSIEIERMWDQIDVQRRGTAATPTGDEKAELKDFSAHVRPRMPQKLPYCVKCRQRVPRVTGGSGALRVLHTRKGQAYRKVRCARCGTQACQFIKQAKSSSKVKKA